MRRRRQWSGSSGLAQAVSPTLPLRGITGMPPGPQLGGLLGLIDPAEVEDYDLVDVIAACERMISWASAKQIEAMSELSWRAAYGPELSPDGYDELRSAACEVAAKLNLAPSTGERRVETARALVSELPGTLGALRQGEIDYRRACAIVDVADRLGPEIARAVEGKVLPKAGSRTIGEHRAAIERAILAVDPQGAEDRHAQAATGRKVEFYPTDDGMGEVVASLTADGIATVRAALDAAASAMKTQNTGETRSMDQLRADALVEMAHGSLRTGWLGGIPGKGLALSSAQGRRPAINVTVPWSTLIGLDDLPAELTGYGPIPASLARRLAADGTWRRLLTDPASGALLDYGTSTYEPPQDLRDFIIARDRTCVFPGCRQPARSCQIDHNVPYPHGPTSAGNLCPLGGPHHNGKTHGHWQLAQPEPGLFAWTSPVGQIYIREPEAIGPIIGCDSDSAPAAGAEDDP